MKRTIPQNPEQVLKLLAKLQKNRKHVIGCSLNRAQSRLELDLSDWANHFYEDIYIPILPATQDRAELVLQRLEQKMKRNDPMTREDAYEIYNLIDKSAL